MIVQGLGDEGATRQQFDQRAQQIGRVAVGRTHVDRVEAEDDGQQPEAGDGVGPFGKFIEGVLNAKTLHRGRRSTRADLRAPLDGLALLDGVGQFVSQQLLAAAGTRLVLVAGEEDVVLVGKGPRAEPVVQACGFGIAMDPHVAEVGIEARFHMVAHVR